MKRIILLVVALCALTTTACGLNTPPDTAKIPDTMTDKVFEDLNVPSDFPKNCHIQYELTIGNSTHTVTFVQCEAGVYIKAENEDILLLKSEGGYLPYAKNANGIFTLSETSRKISRDYVDEFLSSFARLCHTHKNENVSNGKTVTVCGRECTEYTIAHSSVGAECTRLYRVDNETDICLEYILDGDDLYTEGAYSFKCTQFTTENVTLPQHE